MKRVFLFCLMFFYFQTFAQSKDELDLCMVIQANSFTSNTEAENALDRILDVIGVSKNFVLTPCDKISNAVATAYKGTRYILYDREFMNLISKNTNDWSNLFIFAHEVGHHINGHSIDLLLYTNDVVDAPSLEKSRKQELEADEFAAFVLAKLGANLSQLNKVITLISNNSDDTYSTHPKRDKRLASVKVGYSKGNSKEKKLEAKNNTPSYKKYNSNSKYTQNKNWKRLKFNDPFSDNLFEAFVEDESALKFSIKKDKSGKYSIGLYDLNKKYPTKSGYKYRYYKDTFANSDFLTTREVPENYTSKIDVIVINSNGDEIYNSMTNEKKDDHWSLKFYLIGFENGFNQIILSRKKDLLVDYYASVVNYETLLSGMPFQEELENEIEKFISTLKSGNKIFFKLNFYEPDWFNSRRMRVSFGMYSKPKDGHSFKRLQYFTQPGLKSIGGSDIIEYSLSGSSKALAD